MGLFLTADTHFGHEALITKMGRTCYSSIEEHDEAVIDACNAKVGRSDTLLHLGDFAWVTPGKYRQRIKCRHIELCIGNHDSRSKCREVFGNVWDIRSFKIPKEFGGGTGVGCHYPMIYWDKSHYGSYHFYGHLHNARESTLDKFFPQRRSSDVGIDTAIRILQKPEPFAIEELLDYLKDRIGHDELSFYRDKPNNDSSK